MISRRGARWPWFSPGPPLLARQSASPRTTTTIIARPAQVPGARHVSTHPAPYAQHRAQLPAARVPRHRQAGRAIRRAQLRVSLAPRRPQQPRWPATNPPALESSLLTRSPGAACGTAGTTRHRARATGTSETTTCSARTHAAPHSTRNCTTLMAAAWGDIRVGTSASHNRRATVRVQHAGVHWCHVLNCLL